MDEPPACHDPLDLPYVRDVLAQLFIPVSDGYFRPRLLGASRLPPDGPIILACNHSGTAFPYDAIVLDIALWRRDNCEPARKFRSMFAKELAQTWWMRPYGIDNFWRRAGGVDQTFDNFDRLLARGDRVIYYPEGVPGIGKGFQHRYELQPFRTSFVVLAARNNAPVYPVYIVNGEWVMPFNFTWRPLDRLMQICFKVPFLPLPLGAFLPLLLPFTWYLAFPARLVMIVGQPVDMAARLRRRGVDDFSVVDREVAREAAEQLRGEMQAQLIRYVRRYGRWPYNCRLLGRRLAKARGKWWRTLPLGWAVVARAHERNRRRPPARGWLHAVLRDWDLVGFYVPVFGWLILGLARRFRRPPCGFRGMSAEARREQDGGFRWNLGERPLPPRDAVFAPTPPPATTRAASAGDPAAASPAS
ncbi:MAG: 1-acyl-sn-glycerol-3-phosphate acyltransferase [Bacteroidales bacterium]